MARAAAEAIGLGSADELDGYLQNHIHLALSLHDKLKIARRLDDFGVHYIEGGWPGSNPRDMHFFDLARRETFSQARLTAFGSTRRVDGSAEEDPNLNALLKSGAPTVAIFGKSWNLHVEKIMGTTLTQNLDMIRETVTFLKQHGREVVYDAEHFFDGYRENSAYALETLQVTVGAGETAVADFTLRTEAINLDELVVTGTAGSARRREIGNTVGVINSDDLEAQPIVSVTDVLQGRTAGLTVTSMGGNAGSASEITLRGVNTLGSPSGNQPLVYVDGVRMQMSYYADSGEANTRAGAFDSTRPS